MFKVLEKDGERRPVYSKSDLEYLAWRGWREVDLSNPKAEVERVVVHTPPVTKRKYTRRSPR